MEDNNTNWSPIFFGAIVLIVFSWSIGVAMGRAQMRQDAVVANVAEWVAAKDGSAEFKFKVVK